MIVLDTSALVGSLCGVRTALPRLQELLEVGEPLALPTLVLYEWLRGPRLPAELDHQERLFPAAGSLPFTAADAERGAQLYRALHRQRHRQADIAIAACALGHDARVWTLNPRDFADIPGLRLV